MAFGDLPYDAPLKPNKGLEGGACNRQSCQAEPALFYNHGMHKWYCGVCARDIGQDHINRMGWVLSEYYPGHPQFETREEIDKREAEEAERKAAEPPPPPKVPSYADFFNKHALPKPKSSSLERMLGKAKKKR